MLRASYLFLFGLIITFATLAFSQETSIDNALSISKQTGKPIFAIASRKVCGPCKVLKSRVTQLFQNSAIADQVVYLRIDLDDNSWKLWSRKFPHQGRMLPIVYLIRADERQMYGRSNTLPGDQLQKFLEQGIAHCGKSFSKEQVAKLEEVNRSIRNALNTNQLTKAIESMEPVKTMGTPGSLNSYASVAIENDLLIAAVADKSTAHVHTSLASIRRDLDGNSSSRFQAVARFLELQESYGKLESLKDQFSEVAIKLAVDADLRTLWSLGTQIHKANRTLASASTEAAKTQANQHLSEIENGNAPNAAKLAAREVKLRHSAILAGLQKKSLTK